MFSFFKSKTQAKKIVDVNLNQHNASWLLNEELQRMHKLLTLSLSGSSANNCNAFWHAIQVLQQQLIATAAKSQDPDVQKAIADLQNHVVDQILLEEK